MSTAPDMTPAEAALSGAFAVLDTPSPARMEAWDAYAQVGLPHRRMEAWRWSDVRRAAPKALSFPPLAGRPDGGALFSGLDPIELVFVDGRFAWWPKDDPDAAAIVRDFGAPPAPDAARRLPFAALSAALAPDPQMIVLHAGATCARPIWLRFIAETPEAARLTRLAVVVEPGAFVTLIESHEGAAAGLGSVFLEAVVREGALLDRIVLQRGAADDVVVSTADVTLSAGAHLAQTTLAVGAKLARLETHVTHAAEGAGATLDGAYLLDGARHADLTSVVAHTAPRCETRQVVKGAVRDRATGVFQGTFIVDRPAQKTDARMGHHALLLSDAATVNAKPELEIYADDVQCAHGATAGALDPDQLFYLQARGLPDAQAKALLTEAFVAEAFDRVENAAIRETLLGEVRAWLGGVS